MNLNILMVGDRYIPSGIRPITQGGHLIQEGSDNIDINTETVDGKNTFHSMNCLSISICGRTSGMCRTYSTDDTIASLTDALSFIKPKSRVESPRRIY
jgi:hypothetical protein